MNESFKNGITFIIMVILLCIAVYVGIKGLTLCGFILGIILTVGIGMYVIIIYAIIDEERGK